MVVSRQTWRTLWVGNNFIESVAPVVLTWLAFYAVRPFILGLYLDDWVIYRSTPPWTNHYVTFWIFGNRPVLGLYHLATSRLAHGSIILLHAFAAFTVLATACILRKFLREAVSYGFQPQSLAGCNIAVCLWLVMPWTLGTTAWIITNPTLISLMGFCLAGIALLNNWRFQHRLFPLLPISIAVSALSYEMFIVQTPLLLALFYLNPARLPRNAPASLSKCLLHIASAGTAAFALRFALERLDKALGKLTPIKQFNPDWLQILQQNLKPHWIIQSFQAQELIGIAVIAMLATLFALALSFQTPDSTHRRITITTATSLALGGYVLSCALPAIAGYVLTGFGLDSRVTIGVSFWLTFYLAFTLTAALTNRRHWIRSCATLFAFFLAIVFSIAMAYQLQAWKSVWDGERQLLSRVNPESILSLPPGSLVILDKSISKDGIYGFYSSYDLGYAIRDLTGDNRPIQYIVAGDYWKVYADSSIIVQRSGNTVLGQYPSTNAWVLNAETGSLRPVRKQEVLGGTLIP